MATSILVNWLISAGIVATACFAGFLAYECSCRWSKAWRTLARIPLYILGAYVVVSLVELMVYSSLSSMWLIELYVWALLSIAYTGCLLSVKHQYNTAPLMLE